jgi:TusA-related sulfurtransferase
MTFVRTKLKLAQIADGDILEVLLSEGEPLNNVPKSAREQGFNVLKVEHVEGSTYRVIIEK